MKIRIKRNPEFRDGFGKEGSLSLEFFLVDLILDIDDDDDDDDNHPQKKGMIWYGYTQQF